MKKKFTSSLSTKILRTIIAVSLVGLFTSYFVVDKVTKATLYNVEYEKANIIVDTIEPMVAINLYFNIPKKIENIVKNLVNNPNILEIKILNANQILIKKTKVNGVNLKDSFKIQRDILEPNSKKKIGKIVLIYSSKRYEELREKYKMFALVLLLVLTFLLSILGLYIRKLLYPLRTIARALKEYKPKSTVNIPIIKENNEIGLISKALSDMQEKIFQYSKKQEDVNNYLEKMVEKKTKQLKKQLYTNSLTGLPNRLSLLNDIDTLEDGALIIINIDDFKEINDFFGNVAGDSILLDFSHKLAYFLEEYQDVLLKHLHGDEFAFLFVKKPDYSTFMHIIKKLLREIEDMVFYYENNEMGLRVTLGAVYDINEGLEKADIALKLAKKRSESYIVYDESLRIKQQYKKNIDWITKLKNAIEDDRIVPFFQPIFDNKTGKIVSCECLIRLIDEDDSIVSPFEFLPVAKKSRLYNKLTEIMIRKSCVYFENIDCDFSVNLSIADMLNSDIKDYIRYKINKHNVSQKIILEILETEGIQNYEEIISFINEMKALGCRIAIDDFGSGYSNFEYLLKLNIDYVKIDGTLIRNIDKDENAQIVAETVVDFASKLHVKTIAEYVHNEAVFNKVKELNIDRTQGFYLAKPQREVKELIFANHKT